MAQFSIKTPEELDAIIAACLQVTGRSRAGTCIQWMQEGAVRDFETYKRAGLIPDDWLKNFKNNNQPDPEKEDNDE